MKVSFKQKIKSLIAIIIIIFSIILIKINSNVDLASIQEETNEISTVKVEKGSNVYENTINGLNLINSVEPGMVFNSNKIVSLNTKDIKSPDNIKDIDVKINNTNNSVCISFEKPKDNGNKYEYLIENKNKNKTLKFYSESGTQGYCYKINNIEKDTVNDEINKFDEESIILENINWDKDYYLHIRTIDNNNNCSESETLKIDLPSKGINIEYIEAETNKTIAASEKILGMINEQYNVSNLEKKISGYNFLETEGNLTGKLKRESINVKYKYSKI